MKMATVFQLVTYALFGLAFLVFAFHFVFKSEYVPCKKCQHQRELALDDGGPPPAFDEDADSGWGSDSESSDGAEIRSSE